LINIAIWGSIDEKIRYILAKTIEYRKISVPAYCRVSTSGPIQLRSLEIQIETYTRMFESCLDWIYIGVFYDIRSGLKRVGRGGLDDLLRKAKNGKID